MKIYKYGKMTYPIRECPNCGCVFSFNKAFVHYGEINAEGKRYYFVRCPDCFNKFRIERYDLIEWDRKLPDSID